jgi:hypothetical protein
MDKRASGWVEAWQGDRRPMTRRITVEVVLVYVRVHAEYGCSLQWKICAARCVCVLVCSSGASDNDYSLCCSADWGHTTTNTRHKTFAAVMTCWP